MISKLFAALALILVGGSIVWYWENATTENQSYLFYILLAAFLFNIIRSICIEEKLETKIKELSKGDK